jgi:hypothetical protein
MNYCAITWNLDILAQIHTTNRDAAVVAIVLKALTDANRKRSRDYVPEVALTRKRLATFGLSAYRVRQALEALERAGSVSLELKAGQAPRVRFDPSFFKGLKAKKAGGWELA